MTQPPENENDGAGQVRPFAAVLQDVNGGDFADLLSADMQTLTTAVREHGRKGELTIKFTVAPMRGNNALTVTARRSLKLPEEEPVESVFFSDSDGNLVRDDPRQMQLPLRTVNKPEPGTELRKAGQ
ncbi:MAG TPA: hypothetical protein VE465_02240 [Streptosporangiaceae bacterium]|jgi:hypothetical protein|nr:hypothetical protein [Streptosporangiaceae bacterium]